MDIYKIIEDEIREYLEESVEIAEGHNFSQYKLVKRIHLFANQVLSGGKVDSQDNYKFWFDIQSPRIDSEVKNVDFDTKDIIIYSDSLKDVTAVFISNLALKEWMRTKRVSSEINEAIEEGSGWGNVVWKKVKEGFERSDLKNFFVINQVAKSLDDTPVIERHSLTQSTIREKAGVWKNIDAVLKDCANKKFSSTEKGIGKETKIPYYEIYERNGEVSLKDLKEAQKKPVREGDGEKYVLAKIVVAGLKRGGGSEGNKHILYAEELKEMPYKEYHRGRYNGRWWRQGLYEILFDIQVRANEIGNQVARGLEYASKIILRTSDRLIAQNIMTDLMNGDIIKAKDLQQVELKIPGLAQLVTDWNNLMVLADKLCNSYEVVQGQTMPSGTPFRLGALLNINANKLFDFIREKLGTAIEEIFEEWILPDLLKDLKAKKILRLTGDGEYLQRYYEMVIQAWYVRNLTAFGPHTPEQADLLKKKKVEEMKAGSKEVLLKLGKEFWKGFKPRASVIITGENVNIAADMETLATFIGLEMDPVRRQALIERAMAKKGIDITMLPKTEAQVLGQKGAIPQIVQEPQPAAQPSK